jgi:hypothetical protein
MSLLDRLIERNTTAAELLDIEMNILNQKIQQKNNFELVYQYCMHSLFPPYHRFQTRRNNRYFNDYQIENFYQ